MQTMKASYRGMTDENVIASSSEFIKGDVQIVIFALKNRYSQGTTIGEMLIVA